MGKVLAHKLKDLGLDPQHPSKKIEMTVIPALGKQRGRTPRAS